MRQILLQNVTAILLQNATEVYYKMRQYILSLTLKFHDDNTNLLMRYMYHQHMREMQ